MERLVRVQKCLPGGMAKVMLVRHSACSGDCHTCSGCGAVEQTLVVKAVNAIHAREGELVRLRSDSGSVLLGALVLYILPFALFFLGYFLGEMGHRGPLVGCLAFLAGIGCAVAYDRLVLKKKKTVYTIIGYPDDPFGAKTEGDHNID